MKNQVYVVTSGEYSDYHIERIFTTEEAAKEYCSRMNSLRMYDEFDYETYDLCEPEDIVDSGYYITVNYDTRSDHAFTGMSDVVNDGYYDSSKANCQWSVFSFPLRVTGEDVKRGVHNQAWLDKVARDRYAQYKAEKEGIA